MKKKILIIRSYPVDPDPRIERMVEILHTKYDLTVIGWDRTRQCKIFEDKSKYKIKRVRGFNFKSRFGKNLNNFIWILYIQFKILFGKYDVIHTCDFDTYFPAILVSKIKRIPIIYDIFDCYADMLIRLPLWLKNIIKKLDSFSTKFADAVILADDNRIKQINVKNIKELLVIYNTPPDVLEEFESSLKKRNDGKTHISYMGLIDNRKRDLRPFIDIIKMSDNLEFIIGGPAIDEKNLKELISSANNIKYLGNVSYQEALKLQHESDIILALYDPTIQNNVLASPNKLFEAMMLKKPFLINQEIDNAKIVIENKCGLLFKYGDKKSIENLLDEIVKNPQKLADLGIKGRKVYEKKYHFNISTQKLSDLYKNLLNNN